MKNRTFLDFIAKRNERLLNESFSLKKIEEWESKLNSILKSHITNLIPLVGFVETSDGSETYMSKQYIKIDSQPGQERVFQINWLKTTDRLDAYSIDFFDDCTILFDYKAKAKLTIYTLGSSIVYFLPIISNIVNSQDYQLSEKDMIKLGNSIFKSDKVKESYYVADDITYHILDGLTSAQINDAYNINEAYVDKEVNDFKKAKKQKLDMAYATRRNSQEAWKNFLNLRDEYEDIKRAIRNGVTTLDELKVAISRGNNITVTIDDTTKKAEEKFESEKMDPEQVFKMMASYIQMVIKGINPSVILCGAPGVGKTFKVKKLLKENNYNEGHNLYTIKGKCSPRALYVALYNYKEKGKIIVIDDADGLVGPKAPEECINILKGALDSTGDADGRLVTYGVAGKIMDDEGNELPKRFYYNGGIIVITNYRAGALDTALRGRSYMQDINFSTEDLLKIIKKLIPEIDPDKLSLDAKMKAYYYMVELLNKKAEMEVSIRTFKICAQIFESLSSDDDLEIAKHMIKEQLRLQSLRTKNIKY